jgi:tetratricopeptide (TPR) repeat protein
MSTLKPTKKISRRQELRQDTVVTMYARVRNIVDERRNLMYGVLGAIIVVLLGALGSNLYQERQQAEAVELLAPAVSLYEQGQYREALDGIGGGLGLVAIAEDYGSTTAGNLARFYAGDALFRLGEHDQALEFFESFDADENYVGASALAGAAAVYEERSESRKAGDLYMQAASLYPNEVTSPKYLLLAGRAYESAAEYERAVEAYETVSEEYPGGQQAGDVPLLVARAQSRMSSAAKG